MANLKISQLTAKGSKIATTDRVAIAQDDGGGNFSSKYVTGEELFGYKKYVALISQTGTNAPTATVLENSLGGTPTFSYITIGNYDLTLTSAFPASKTWVVGGSADISAGGGDFATLDIKRSTDNIIKLRTYDNFTPANDMLVNTSIEIRVYP